LYEITGEARGKQSAKRGKTLSLAERFDEKRRTKRGEMTIKNLFLEYRGLEVIRCCSYAKERDSQKYLQ